MSPDFLDIVRALSDADARFIIVGAYAVNLYVDPRATAIWTSGSNPRPKTLGKFYERWQILGLPWRLLRNPISPDRESRSKSASYLYASTFSQRFLALRLRKPGAIDPCIRSAPLPSLSSAKKH